MAEQSSLDHGSQKAEKENAGIGAGVLLFPLSFYPGPSPWDDAAHIQCGSFSLVSPSSLETTHRHIQRCALLVVVGDSKFNQIDNQNQQSTSSALINLALRHISVSHNIPPLASQKTPFPLVMQNTFSPSR
jgi:hypothetical protein